MTSDTIFSTSLFTILGQQKDVVDIESLMSVSKEIESDWLTEALFQEVHRYVLAEYPFMAWVYRTLPTEVGSLILPLAYKVPWMMREIFAQIDISTLDGIVEWFISTLEEVHPFQDGNRRTCFICLEAHLRHIGYDIVNLGDKRREWESIHYSSSNLPKEDRFIALKTLILSTIYHIQ
jgi:fido (protein-threonine AMPylation protein)